MLAVVLLLQVAAPQVWAAAYGGTFNSATPQTPVTLGQALGTTVAVKNTGILPWQENASAAWRTTVDSPSWAATWSSLRFDSVANVNAGANASMIVNLSAAQLPTVPGDYSVRFHTSYNQSGFYTELSGSPKTVSFTIASGNHAPVVTPVGERTAVESNLLSFTVTATDADSPTQKLAFSLEAGAPAGASVNSSNGLFTWTPPLGYTPQTNLISVRVTDDGTPALSATNSFNVIVLRLPRFLSLSRPTNGVVTLFWQSHPGKTYRLAYKDSLVTGAWTDFASDTVATNYAASATNAVGTTGQRYYRLLLLN